MSIYIPIPAFELVHWLLLIMYVIGIVAVWFAAEFMDAIGGALVRSSRTGNSLWNFFIAVTWPISVPILGGIGLVLHIFR